MTSNAQIISAAATRLIFKGGKMPDVSNTTPAAKLLTDDATSVCQLLAINPEDIVPRDIDQFKEKGISGQRLQLRF